jgi:hypothetical protein
MLVYAVALAALGTGCSTYKDRVKVVTKPYSMGNVAEASKKCRQIADKPSAKEMVVWNLEAGMIERVCGDYTNSNRYLERAAEQIAVYDEQAKISISKEAAAALTTQENLPYRGKSYDKIMLYTYKALNYLALGEIEKARPEIIHAYQCQQDAVEDNARRIEKAQEEEAKNKDKATIEKSKADPKYAAAVEAVNKDLEGFKFYADYVNPFTVYLDGIYFLHAGAGQSDLERARKSLSRVVEVAGSNKFIQADLQLAENGGSPQNPACTYVIFETGEGASLDQVRIDIPIVVVNVSYVGIAFPKLAVHNNHAAELTVKAGAVEEKTAAIGSLDSVIALDFKNEFPIILTKAMITTIAKAAATYAVNKATESNSYANLASKLVTLFYGAATNIADTRSWTTLPKEFQVARVPTPADRKLVLSTPGSSPVEVALMDGAVNVVYAKSINANCPLLVSQFKLK